MIADYRHRGSPPKPKRRRSFAARLFRLAVAFAVVVAATFALRQWIGWAKQTDLFRMQRVAIRGLVALPPESVLQAADVEPGTNLFRISTAEIEARILKLDRVEIVRVKRALPRTLAVLVVERTPVALVALGKIYEADAGGHLMETPDRTTLPDLPVITGVAGDDFAGEAGAAPEALRRLLADLGRLQREQPWLIDMLSDIRVNPDGSLTAHALKRGVPVLLGDRLDPVKLGILRTMLADLDRIEGGAVSIDLRFRKQGILRRS